MPDYSGHITHEEYRETIKTHARAIAEAIIDGSIGVLEGCAQMMPLLKQLGISDCPEYDSISFAASDGDEFAFGSVRELWSPSLLADRDVKQEKLDEEYRADVQVACLRLLERFEHH